MDGDILQHTLGNGITLLGDFMEGRPVASFCIAVPAGYSTEPEERLGVTSILSGMLMRQTRLKSPRDLSNALESMGLHRGEAVRSETAQFSGALPADELLQALRLYAEILRNPQFMEKELEAERLLAMQVLESLEDRPARKVMLELRKQLITSPHGRSSLGTLETLAEITCEDLVREHERRFKPGNLLIAIAGSFSWGPLVACVEKLFGDWAGSAPRPPSVSIRTEEHRHCLLQETAQQQIAVGYSSVGLAHADFYSLRLAASVLSGGMSSRLFTEVRERRGLVYSVHASLVPLPRQGVMLCYAGTTPQHLEETERVMKQELIQMQEGISEAELERGRTGILSSLMMDQESSLARTGRMVSDFRSLGRVRSLKEIRAGYSGLSVSDVNNALRNHPAGPFTTVQLGPGSDRACPVSDIAGENSE
jgi:predicted Zn-dependent peptidase